MQYTLAVYFASGVGPCTRIVEPFKHLLRVTAHPQFLVLELRAPMGACSGQYSTPTNLHGILHNVLLILDVIPTLLLLSCMFEKKKETPITMMSNQNLLSHTLAFAIYMSIATSAAHYETSYDKYVHA